ncbi:MAG: 6-aminohexanoate hydrolase [Caulobacterales bacterium 32-69-10]|nr:MAG: 6-aminohexanoate hydrolase [Caulobacterales bacterium 32-69-10]
MTLTRRFVCTGLGGALLAPAAACGQAAPPAETAAAPAPEQVRDLDSAALTDAFTGAATLPQLRTMIVAQNGRVVREQVFRGPGLDTPVNIKSASKSIIAALAGCALDRGVLKGLDQPIGPILGARIPAAADPRARLLTIEQLLSMAAGLERTSGQNYGRWVSSRDWVAYALSQPFVAEPGGRMLYSTGTSHIMSAVLTRAAGRSTLDLAREWLGRPLGITVPPWTRDPQGIYFGGNEMALSPRALLRFGEMYRNGGLHGATRVLSAAFVEDSWRSRGGRSPYTGYTYGLGWWLREAGPHRVNFAWGYGGQMVFVIPSLALSVVMTSDPTARGGDGHVPALHRLVDETIVARTRSG